MLLYRVGDCVMHLCPVCNRRTINVLDDDDDDDDDDDSIGNIFGMQQDIVNRKTALQTTDTPAQELNSVYFGPQTAENRTGVLTHPTSGHQAGQCHTSSYSSTPRYTSTSQTDGRTTYDSNTALCTTCIAR